MMCPLKTGENEMTDTNNTSAKKRPDYITYAVRSQGDNQGPRYTRIGVAFSLRNGGISVLYDATPLSGQIVLLETDAEKPTAISYGHPTRKPDFEASMVRDAGPGNSFWTEIGVAYRQDGYVSIFCDVVPNGGKIILTQPKVQE
jgi:hypothetical protein